MDKTRLNEEQRRVIETLDRNILLLAPAGTGKTDTLSWRIAHILELGLAAPEEILCLTFTNKACREMQTRIEAILPDNGRRVCIRTIHSLCLEIIRQEAKRQTEIFSDFTVFDEEDSKEVIHDLNGDGFPDTALQNLINLIVETRAGNDIYSENETEDFRKTVQWLFTERREKIRTLCVDGKNRFDEALENYIARQGAELTAEYRQSLAKMHGIDFAGLIERAYALFRDETIADRWRAKFHFLTIDEVQDTSELEYAILSQLFPGNRVLLTGDYFQTIYEWRGSNPAQVLARYEKDCAPLRFFLRKNYRATRTLLRASHDCLDAFFPSEHSALCREEPEAASPSEGGLITLKACRNMEEEAAWIYRTLLTMAPADPSRVCILTRSNIYNKRLCQALARAGSREGTSWPFMLIDEFQFFRRQEIKDALAFMKLAINRHDRVSLRRILKRFGLGIGAKTIEKIESAAMRTAGLRLTDFLDETAIDRGDPFALLLDELENENVIVFDVESTGVDTFHDEIVQIAAIRIGKDGMPRQTFQRFLRNQRSVGASEAVHGFSDDFLRAHGEEPRKVLADFLDFLRGALIVGHNVTYDITILVSELERLDMPEPDFRGCFDTLDIFRRFYPNLPNHRLEFLGDYFHVTHKSSHDAFDDICATAELLLYAVENNIRPTAGVRRSCVSTFGKVFHALASSFTTIRELMYKKRPTDFLAHIVKSQLLEYYKNDEKRVDHLRHLYCILRDRDDETLPPREALRRLLTLATLSNSEFEMSLKDHPKTPIITVHQAKGAEFDTVFLAGMQDNVFPSFPAVKNGQIEEEKRLFYVAITRAKQDLFLSWCQYNDRGYEQTPSPFLSAIPWKYVRSE